MKFAFLSIPNHSMKPTIKQISFILTSIGFVLGACSTEKNSWLSRSYHGVTAKYNGHWNAEELMNTSMKSFESNYEDNYYELLPLEILPNETEVKGLFPAIDTAISKCTKVIANHSMPTASKPWAKDVENNTWIDENWLTIGEALYLRRDYVGALKNFEYIAKFWKNDQSIYLAEVWKARTNLALGNETEAIFNIALVEKFIDDAEEEAKSKDKTAKKTSKKASSRGNNKKKETPPKPTKELKYGLFKAKTHLALAQGDIELASKNLELAIKACSKKRDKARLYYILGQLFEQQNRPDKAQECYAKVLKYPASYQMLFHARINRAVGGGEKVRKDLKKMLKDEKNLEFRDQIYFALGQLDLKENKEDLAKVDLHLSVKTSINNGRQKGMSYEILGDLALKRRDYVPAQKYYDSCVRVLPKDFPRFEVISIKAEKLKELVVQVNTIEKEDSLQKIAALSPEDRVKFIEKEIKRIKKEELERKAAEAERLAAMQASRETAFVQSNKGGNWYWNNPKTRAEGLNEFKKTWGSRENEDNWRRSRKMDIAVAKIIENDTSKNGSTQVKEDDSLSVANLMMNIPFGDSSIAASNKRLIEALYNAGTIYTDQLNEDQKAYVYLDRATKMQFEDKHRLLSSYKIYSMFREKDETKAIENRDYILTNYPTSDYAGYLRDPNYFIKKKQIEALAQDEYVNTLERYNRKIYSIVIAKADVVIAEQKENPYRAKYMLLKALSIGQTSEDKQLLVPILSAVLEEYSGTDEAKRAQELLDILKNGFSVSKPFDGNKKGLYKKQATDEFQMVLFLPLKENSNPARIKVSDYNKNQYSRDKLTTTSKIFGQQSVILVKTFPTLDAAKEYIASFKASKSLLGDLIDYKLIFISQDNLKTLFESQNLEDYESFMDDNY